MDIGTILGIIVAGLIIGALGRLIVPGRNPIGVLGTILIGIAGALLAGLVAHYLIDPESGWVTLLIAVLFAAGLVAIFGRSREPGY